METKLLLLYAFKCADLSIQPKILLCPSKYSPEEILKSPLYHHILTPIPQPHSPASAPHLAFLTRPWGISVGPSGAHQFIHWLQQTSVANVKQIHAKLSSRCQRQNSTCSWGILRQQQALGQKKDIQQQINTQRACTGTYNACDSTMTDRKMLTLRRAQPSVTVQQSE